MDCGGWGCASGVRRWGRAQRWLWAPQGARAPGSTCTLQGFHVLAWRAGGRMGKLMDLIAQPGWKDGLGHKGVSRAGAAPPSPGKCGHSLGGDSQAPPGAVWHPGTGRRMCLVPTGSPGGAWPTSLTSWTRVVWQFLRSGPCSSTLGAPGCKKSIVLGAGGTPAPPALLPRLGLCSVLPRDSPASAAHLAPPNPSSPGAD